MERSDRITGGNAEMEKYIGKYSVKDFLYLILGAVIYSIGTHSFIETADIAPGGAVGVALMLNHVTNLPVGRLTLMVNVPLLILAWFHLSRAFALRTALACGICSVVLDYVIAPVFPVYMGDQLMGSLYGGILVGVGMAFIFLSGSTTGGSDVVGYLLQKKYPHISIGACPDDDRWNHSLHLDLRLWKCRCGAVWTDFPVRTDEGHRHDHLRK